MVGFIGLYHVHVQNRHGAVKITADRALAIPSHHSLTGREVFRCEDGRGDDERNVRGVYVACLEVAAALVADEDLVA